MASKGLNKINMKHVMTSTKRKCKKKIFSKKSLLQAEWKQIKDLQSLNDVKTCNFSKTMLMIRYLYEIVPFFDFFFLLFFMKYTPVSIFAHYSLRILMRRWYPSNLWEQHTKAGKSIWSLFPWTRPQNRQNPQSFLSAAFMPGNGLVPQLAYMPLMS